MPAAEVMLSAPAQMGGALVVARADSCLPGHPRPGFARATAKAVDALAGVGRQPPEHRDRLAPMSPFGPAALRFRRHRGALGPDPAGPILEPARPGGTRSITGKAVLRRCFRDRLPQCVPVAEQIERPRHGLTSVREFRTGRERPGVLGERDAGVRYVPEPVEDWPRFRPSDALGRRLGPGHEGVHVEQLAFGARHGNPARRPGLEPTPNGGIAFHHEELVRTPGRFDDAPAPAARPVAWA
ncbi:hypothetical protein [Amycolatopsis sp. PS_44_ISF1]|uniref:hypothetical protein n=1 Tax=Amycolatopsis sp. PS_44_ISF1 TaxID=2974917 RepID=UPI0028DD9783|nr:hypothetical protein [Amycolatopsis sp. PS_44_ISF1]MDT8914690.1 hypothetical protein [Amycolatopsis sp. PS_44_ISF1]